MLSSFSCVLPRKISPEQIAPSAPTHCFPICPGIFLCVTDRSAFRLDAHIAAASYGNGCCRGFSPRFPYPRTAASRTASDKGETPMNCVILLCAEIIAYSRLQSKREADCHGPKGPRNDKSLFAADSLSLRRSVATAAIRPSADGLSLT